MHCRFTRGTGLSEKPAFEAFLHYRFDILRFIAKEGNNKRRLADAPLTMPRQKCKMKQPSPVFRGVFCAAGGEAE
jgi:hypothetical protein